MSTFNEASQAATSPKEPNGCSPQDYFVTVFKTLPNGNLFALVLRVSVEKDISWVRAHVDEIAAIGVQSDKVARELKTPIVALNVSLANSSA